MIYIKRVNITKYHKKHNEKTSGANQLRWKAFKRIKMFSNSLP